MPLEHTNRCSRCNEGFWAPAYRQPDGVSPRKYCSVACYRASARHTPEDIKRIFWSRVNKKGPGGCWLWTGSVYNGYGATNYERKFQGAHRVSWRFANGEITNGLHVLHRCDVKLCVNPKHLFLGTDADNTADKIAKGRYRGRYTPIDQLLHPELSFRVTGKTRARGRAKLT